jgi:hypothetical protein
MHHLNKSDVVTESFSLEIISYHAGSTWFDACVEVLSKFGTKHTHIL